MTAAEALEACDWIAGQTPDTLKSMADISGARAALAPLAALVLGRLVERLSPADVSVSAFGLREGVYFERLPETVRRRDPLLETARLLEQAQARFPGFGEELSAWLAPLTAGYPAAERRYARTACLLNDVNWRAHPDYRAVSCFETVTRANLAGLDHAGRVWIGLALMLRYGGPKGGGADLAGALDLLDAAQFARAEAVGRALRLGAMISASTPGALADAPLRVEDGALRLTLAGSLASLSGDLIGRRLKALASAMGREAVFEG
jgi:exopolyphosphatase/guanosine-5'-triphosphate,3'-diphosphate pyrophosphatase